MEGTSPLFENIANIMDALPQGHDKPVKRALYNALGNIIFVVALAVTWCLYLVLSPFVKPLGWALLVGSVLYPLKRAISTKCRNWFTCLDQKHTPIAVGFILLPFQVFNDIGDFLGCIIRRRFRIIISICVTVPVLATIYYFTPNCVCHNLIMISDWSKDSLHFIISYIEPYMIAIIVIFYLKFVYFVWTPNNNRWFHFMSIFITMVASFACVHHFDNPVQTPIFIAVQAILFIGFVTEIYAHSDENRTVFEALRCTFKLPPAVKRTDENPEKTVAVEEAPVEEVRSPVPEEEPPKPQEQCTSGSECGEQGTDSTDSSSTAKKKRRFWFFKHRKRNEKCGKSGQNCGQHDTDSVYDSSFYMYTVVWLCVIMLICKNVFLLPLLPVPIIFYAIKQFGYYLGIWSFTKRHWNCLQQRVKNWTAQRYDVFVPAPLKGIVIIIKRIDQIINGILRDSIDTVSSCLVICILIVFVVCASVFIVLQIYAEALMLIQMLSNVVRQTLIHNPELSQILPKSWEDSVDAILNNAYLYGREGISKTVKSLTATIEVGKAEKLETQVLDLWDRVYQSWMTSEHHGPRVTSEAIQASWNQFWADIQKTPELLNFNGILEFAKQNIGVLTSVLDSIWFIVKGNLSVLFSSSTTLLSILLGGGSAVINFIINGVVFFTALFYLLNSSGELYKPVELLTNFSTAGSRMGHALEAACNGVFTASFKMATFYGLWTWFIHNLFGVKIVYLPTAFATIFGVAPFLGTYWACVPAVLDLWLGQKRGLVAVIFAIAQFLPTSCVDSQIYSEIRGGGHPYLTGLAIAGGIFYLGVEGAIIGPLLLCALYVAIDLASNYVKDSSPTMEHSRSAIAD